MLPFNKLDIINSILAFWRIEPVSQESEIPKSKILDRAFKMLLPRFLELELQWSFLITTAKLTVTTPPSYLDPTVFNYQFVYALPLDFMQLVNVSSTDYLIVKPYILCSDSTVNLQYIRYSEDYATFPAYFIQCFALFVAAMYCYSMERDSTLASQLAVLFQNEFNRCSAYENAIRPDTSQNFRGLVYNMPNEVM
jgi:hypothetical protein